MVLKKEGPAFNSGSLPLFTYVFISRACGSFDSPRRSLWGDDRDFAPISMLCLAQLIEVTGTNSLLKRSNDMTSSHLVTYY